MQLLASFWDTLWIRMLETFEKEGIRCSRGFFEKISAISKKNDSNCDKIDKNSKKTPIVMQHLSYF